MPSEAGPPKAPPEGTPGVPLESPQRLSQSLIWLLQRAYYLRQGPGAWKTGAVPFYSTSNPYFARTYARMVVAFLRDLAAAGSLDRSEPVYLMELAAGSGQFAFFFLRAFGPLQRLVPALEGLRVVYVMTDLVESNVAAWVAHERLEPFVAAGRLDFAQFDIERDEAPTLRHAGTTLAPGTLRNPLLAVANYAFDTTLQDAFWVKEGRLYEGRITPVSSRADPDPADPDLLQRVSLRWSQEPAELPYYGDPVLDKVLAGYRERLGDTFFLMPVGAFRAVRVLSDLADGRLFLICGDKAFTHEAELKERPEPLFVLHESAFSYTVNLHALGLWFEENGGLALHPPTRDVSVRISAFVRGLPGLDPAETRSVFVQSAEGFSPPDYHTLIKNLALELRQPSLPVMQALIRLGDGDQEILFVYADALVKAAKAANPLQAAELRVAMRRAWDGFYPMTRDLAYHLGRISLSLRQPTEAARYLAESIRLFGPQAMNLMSLAFAFALLDRTDEALKFIDRSLGLKPDNPPARRLRDYLVSRQPLPADLV